MSGPISVVIAHHSGYGHTARQAAAVAAGVDAVPGVWADLRQFVHGREAASLAVTA
jgi:NAD(P)H dehydrogenase (quinone)